MDTQSEASTAHSTNMRWDVTRWQSLRFTAFLLAATLATPAQIVAGTENAQAPASTQAGADTANANPEQIAAAAAERATFGLPAEVGTVSALLGSSRDVGTPRWGIAMTAEEEASIDLPGRMRFADDLEDAFLPYARSLPTFAGAWIDQASGGGVVVGLTEISPVIQKDLEALTPQPSRGVRLVAAVHTENELRDALDAAMETWSGFGGPQPLSVYVDERRGSLVVNVLRSDGAAAYQVAPQVSGQLGVPVVVVADETERPRDIACTTRSNCSDPYRAGVLIREGSVSGEPPCTLAFPILANGDIQVLTAGHCGYYGSDWYHPGEGRVGIVQSNLWVSGGKDVLRMSMYDVQGSEMIYGYGTNDQYSGAGVPTLNETLCASMAMSDRVDCGTVQYTYGQYWSDTIGFWVYGGKLTGLTPIPIDGDSGSPIYRSSYITGADPHWLHTPVGILTTEFGEFARVKDALDSWRVAIWQG